MHSFASTASFAVTLLSLLFLVIAVNAQTAAYGTGTATVAANATFSSATLKSTGTGGAVATSSSTGVPGAAAVNGVAGMTVAMVGAVAAAFVAAL